MYMYNVHLFSGLIACKYMCICANVALSIECELALLEEIGESRGHKAIGEQ